MMEALACHPLGTGTFSKTLMLCTYANAYVPDTIKVRMQLSRRARAPGVRSTNLVFHILSGHLLTGLLRRNAAVF